MICRAPPNAIFSPEPESGPPPPVLPDGATIGRSGQQAVRASRSASQAKEPVAMTQGTYGRTYFDSSVPPGPLFLWESRLRARLATIGSQESALIWKVKLSSAGQSISRLARLTRLTNATGYSGSLWPTPLHRAKGGGSYADPAKALARIDSRHQANLQDHMCAMWSTPRASGGEKGGLSTSWSAGGQPLPAQIHGTTWIGLTAPTEKRGAPNPVFACWLMGWPEELTSGALRAIQLPRRSRRKFLRP